MCQFLVNMVYGEFHFNMKQDHIFGPNIYKCEEKLFEPLEFFTKLSVLKWDYSDAMLY